MYKYCKFERQLMIQVKKVNHAKIIDRLGLRNNTPLGLFSQCHDDASFYESLLRGLLLILKHRHSFQTIRTGPVGSRTHHHDIF